MGTTGRRAPKHFVTPMCETRRTSPKTRKRNPAASLRRGQHYSGLRLALATARNHRWPSGDDLELDVEVKDQLERTLVALQELPDSLRVPLLMSAV